MALSESELEQIEERQEELGLSDSELERVKDKTAIYNPLQNPKGDDCSACGEEDCIKSLSYVDDDGTMIHTENHPNMKSRRGEESR